MKKRLGVGVDEAGGPRGARKGYRHASTMTVPQARVLLLVAKHGRPGIRLTPSQGRMFDKALAVLQRCYDEAVLR